MDNPCKCQNLLSRWLLDSGRTAEAHVVLCNIGRSNAHIIDTENLGELLAELEKSIQPRQSGGILVELKRAAGQIFLLVKTPEIRRRVLLLIPTFFAIGMATYGIHFAARFARINIFMIATLKGVANIAVIIPLMFIYRQVSRTKCLILFYTISAFVSISFMLVPVSDSGLTVARPVLLVLAQALFTGNYYLVDTYAPELMPTNVRNLGFNVMECVSKFGSALAPFVVDLGGEKDPGIPPAVFGALILVASVCFYFLPETKNETLPPTVEHIEQNPGKSIAFSFCH